MLVKRLENFESVDVVLYTEIAATIDILTAETLARFAIESVKETEPGRDGITYLMDARRNGIETALSGAYEAEILRQLGCRSLEEALTRFQK